MTSQQVQQIIDALNHAAGAGFEALVRQQVVNGWQEIGVAFVLLMIAMTALIVSVVARRQSRRSDLNEDEQVGWVMARGAAYFVCAAFVVAAVLTANDSLSHIINPAGSALQAIIDAHK